VIDQNPQTAEALRSLLDRWMKEDLGSERTPVAMRAATP
jgi:hypothetical protein